MRFLSPRRLLPFLLIVTALLIGALLWLRAIWPQALPDAPQATGRPGPAVPCLSYAPFRDPALNPLHPGPSVSPARIEADLRQLRTLTNCVRTYAVDRGLEAVPAVAERLGMRVKLGAWIGRDPVANARQIREAIALARAHPQSVELLIVGNEVLLRQEQSPQALAALLAAARRDSPVPVTYADVWEFWWRHAEVLRPHVDRVTVHILPDWEDEPVAVDEAVDHVLDLAARTQAHFPDLPILVGETGWPAAGRQRQGAVPGRIEQARFHRELLLRSAGLGLDFNLIEAFDQPWKRALEGEMGQAWGLFTAAGQPRFPWQGPVDSGRAPWPVPLAAGLLALLAWRLSRGQLRPLGVGSVVAAAALAGGLLPAQTDSLLLWGRAALDPWIAGLTVACGLLLALGLVQALMRRLQALEAGQDRPSWPGLREAWTTSQPAPRRLAATVRGLYLFGVATLLLWQVLDGRYRGFPLALLVGPAVLGVALATLGERLPATAREERLMAALFVAGALALPVIEGLANQQALAYAAGLLALGLPLLLPPKLASSASSRAGAEGSAA